MSELKAVYATDKDSVTSLYYPKSVVDKVLAEKDKEIAELKGDNETLKKQRDDLFTQGTQKAFDLVGEKLRHRATRRALYKACANWACAKMEYEQFDSNMFMCGFITDKEVSWESMMKKCLKKAEEFR